MPRIMALDVGEKTIGVALSDETGTMAFPGMTLWRQEGWKRDMAALRQETLVRLGTRHQTTNPFAFIVYSGLSGLELPVPDL